MITMCTACFSYQPQTTSGRWISAEGRLFCSTACAETHLQLPARRALVANAPIQPGDTVTRKTATCRTGKPGQGIVESVYTREQRGRQVAYRLYARVKWLSVYQKFSGGGQDMHSDLLLTALVKVAS